MGIWLRFHQVNFQKRYWNSKETLNFLPLAISLFLKQSRFVFLWNYSWWDCSQIPIWGSRVSASHVRRLKAWWSADSGRRRSAPFASVSDFSGSRRFVVLWLECCNDTSKANINNNNTYCTNMYYCYYYSGMILRYSLRVQPTRQIRVLVFVGLFIIFI